MTHANSPITDLSWCLADNPDVQIRDMGQGGNVHVLYLSFIVTKPCALHDLVHYSNYELVEFSFDSSMIQT